MENDKALQTKKSGRVTRLARAALFMFRTGSHKPPASSKTGGLKGFEVGTVRPMHQLPASSPASPQQAELFNDTLLLPQSPAASGMSRYASSGNPLQRIRYASAADLRELETSQCALTDNQLERIRYASAGNLQELERSARESNGADDDGDGDDAIDAKAEEFIAKFYEQMRLQQLESRSVDSSRSSVPGGPQ